MPHLNDFWKPYTKLRTILMTGPAELPAAFARGAILRIWATFPPLLRAKNILIHLNGVLVDVANPCTGAAVVGRVPLQT